MVGWNREKTTIKEEQSTYLGVRGVAPSLDISLGSLGKEIEMTSGKTKRGDGGPKVSEREGAQVHTQNIRNGLRNSIVKPSRQVNRKFGEVWALANNIRIQI